MMMIARFAPLAALTLATSVLAAPFTVDTTADAPDADPGNTLCATAANACSLRAAIQEANALGGPDQVILPAGTYTLSIAGTGEDGGATGDLDVTEDLQITGAGPGATIVDAAGIDRVFDIAASSIISGLTIQHGLVTGLNGGGIFSAPVGPDIALSVRDVHFTANRANHGGAIQNEAGSALVVERASFSANTASFGAAVENKDGSATLTNVTVSGNVSPNHALANDEGGTLVLAHLTLVGGAIGGAGTVILRRSILDDGATADVCADNDTSYTSEGYNLEHGTSCPLGMTGDQSGIDPALGSLGDNGGGTLTHGIAATSPAVDAAGDCPPPTTDQRGKTRPLDGDGDATASCDVGAFELDPADPPTTTTTTTATTTTTTTLPGGCSPETTFTAVNCLASALVDSVEGAAGAGTFRDRLVASLIKAVDRVNLAQAAVDGGKAKKGKTLLAKAARLVKRARAKIGAKKGVAAIPDATARATLQSNADTLRAALLALRDSLG